MEQDAKKHEERINFLNNYLMGNQEERPEPEQKLIDVFRCSVPTMLKNAENPTHLDNPFNRNDFD